ncbi:MAG TPA: DoxX family protein [Granulicella sp.]|jgi:uncharacterized membrane protein YphA (DoxX/SURF4 family)
MFYRVDYTMAVLLAGFLIGLLVGTATEKVAATPLARRYYAAIAILLVLRTSIFAYTMLISPQSVLTTVGGITGDLSGLLFGVLFGLAVRRKDTRELLIDPSIFGALCMALAFTFALTGVGKAFSMAPMTDFFTQSGYSVTFLKFIVIAEVFAGIGLLLPWAVVPALIGLTVDMFGAVLTHIHNGDPLNDSTGAIGALIRLFAVGVLWALSRRTGSSSPSVRRSILSVATVGAVCLLIAIGGSAAMRHLGAAATHLSK